MNTQLLSESFEIFPWNYWFCPLVQPVAQASYDWGN